VSLHFTAYHFKTSNQRASDFPVYMLSSKIENPHWAEKTTTTRCGIRETATTRNFVLWLFLNNNDVVTVN